MWWRLFGISLMAVAVPARAADPDLGTPVKIRAGGQAIDVDGGHAAPFIADLKGDGTRSLLVGQCADGKLRIYPEAGKGKKAEPRFEAFSWFEDGQPSGRVPWGPDSGFTPFVADLNGDGSPDILSGSLNGELYLFRGKGDGKFYAGELIKDQNNKVINVGKNSTVCAFDWLGHGVLDLIVGTAEGKVFLIPNAGSPSNYAFGKAKKMTADDKDIQVAMGHSHPIAADWDGDGKPDLLVGTGAGSVVWYRNIGSRDNPKLAAARTLIDESPLAKNINASLTKGQWGLRAKIAVVDWKGDGKLVLLMGDYGQERAPVTDADKIAEHRARHDLANLQRDYRKALDKAVELEKVPAKETAKTRKDREKKLQQLRTDVARMQRDEALAQQNLAKLVHPYSYHGHVWLFQRSLSPGDSASPGSSSSSSPPK
jgi:hypothetical protein